MKTYEQVYTLLETMDRDDKMAPTLKCWLEGYNDYWKARVKLAELKRSFDWNVRHNIVYNEYIIKRQEVEVGYYKRAIELMEERMA